MLCERTTSGVPQGSPFILELSAVQSPHGVPYLSLYSWRQYVVHNYLYFLADVEEGGFLVPGASLFPHIYFLPGIRLN